jgi:hypothetical protein
MTIEKGLRGGLSLNLFFSITLEPEAPLTIETFILCQ